MRTRTLAAAVLALAASGGAHATVLTLSATDAEFSNRTGSFQPDSIPILGQVGADFIAGEARYALQFNPAALPSDATVTQATLRLRDSQGASNIFVYGFAGNGTFSASSVTTGTQLFQTQAGTSGPVTYDVSAFVEGLTAGAYVGFSLRQVPPSSSYGVFDNSQGFFSPLLTITYTEPGPSPVPEPASLAVFGTGAAGLLALRRRRKAV